MRHSALRLVGSGVTGQTASSVLALSIGLALADLLDVEGFGVYGVLFGIFSLGHGIAVASAGEGVLLAHRGAPALPRRSLVIAARHLLAVTVLELCAVAVALHVADGQGWLWLYVATWLPLHVIDVGRLLAGMAHTRACEPVLLLSATVSAGLWALGHPAVSLVVGASGLVVAGALVVLAHVRATTGVPWVVRAVPTRQLATEAVVIGGLNLVATAGTGVVGGLDAVAALRAGTLLLGVITPVVSALRVLTMRKAATAPDPAAADRVLRSVGVLSTAVPLVVAGSLTAFLTWPPTSQALGATGDLASGVLLPLALARGLSATSAVQLIGLRLVADWSGALVLRCTGVAVGAVAQVAGASLGGAGGAAWGSAAAALVALLMLLRRRQHRRREAERHEIDDRSRLPGLPPPGRGTTVRS